MSSPPAVAAPSATAESSTLNDHSDAPEPSPAAQRASTSEIIVLDDEEEEDDDASVEVTEDDYVDDEAAVSTSGKRKAKGQSSSNRVFLPFRRDTARTLVTDLRQTSRSSSADESSNRADSKSATNKKSKLSAATAKEKKAKPAAAKEKKEKAAKVKEAPPIVELKNNKFTLKQKPISSDNLASTMRGLSFPCVPFHHFERLLTGLCHVQRNSHSTNIAPRSPRIFPTRPASSRIFPLSISLSSRG